MYFNILKRDMKRKKTMNIILLLFTILAATFVASGLSNVVTVMNGTDYFLDQAGIGEYMVITQNGDGGVGNILEESGTVKDYRLEHTVWASRDNITVNGELPEVKNNTLVIQALQKDGANFFLSNNEKLTHVSKGDLYITAGFLKANKLKIGDEMSIRIGDTNMTFSIAGEIKDALLGSNMMGNTRIILSDEDYQVFEQDESLKPYRGCIFYIDLEGSQDFSSELAKASNILFDGSRSLIKLSYVMEMIVAMIVLVVSVCLIIVSFVVLRFVITFSMKEEFREIGVMKAIGIENRKIRCLYVVKYLAIAVVSGLIGLGISIPLGNILIASVSQKMLLENGYGIWFNVIGAGIVIFLMVWFAYLCTGMVKKYSPLDAIRSGQTGERYRKKSVISLGKGHMNGTFFMAVNDVLSSPKRFLTIILSFFLCAILVNGVVLVTDTMKSKNLISTFGKEADVYITDTKLVRMDLMSVEGNEVLKEQCREMEGDLADMEMPGKVSMEVWYKYTCETDGESFTLTFQQNMDSKASEYEYIEGTAPQSADEIAITPAIAEKTGAKIGDVMTVDFCDEKRDCMVVAYFQTMNQLGTVIRLHEDAPTSMEYASAMMAYQIEFEDHPSDEEISSRIEKIKDFYQIQDVFDAAGYCADCIGVVETMEDVGNLLLLITCLVVILVTVLMERSFISDETGEIALLKAIGFQDKAILKWHIYRFMIVGCAAEIMAVVLTVPVTKLWCNPIWNMMGAAKVKYYFKPLSLLAVYPGIVLLITLLAVTVTALYMKKIRSRDIVNIE